MRRPDPRPWVHAVGALLCAGLILSTTIPAGADVRRYAIVVGTNYGNADEPDLQYAEEDARRVANVLGQFGNVAPEDLVLLLDADSDTFERVMSEVNGRIQSAGAEGDTETVLIVYYSGHADARSMHMRGTEFGFREFKKLLRSSGADVRLFIIDACRSGGVTRVKGATPAAPFDITADDRLRGEGTAIITSSAASEDAQESDRLGGSFFTHHLVTAMLGAADRSADRKVTLAEAYEYAYTETIRSTSSARFVQHPTYSFQIKGRADLVLTRLDNEVRGLGELVLKDAGSYVLFMEDDTGPIAAELSVEAMTALRLDSGDYLVRLRGRRAAFETVVRVDENGSTAVSKGEMTRVPYGRLVRKGLGESTRSAIGLTSGATVSTELLPGTGPVALGTAGVQMDLSPVSLQLRLRYGQDSASNDLVALEQQILGGEATVLRLFDLDQLALGFGLRAGMDWIGQTLSSDGVAPNRSSLTTRGGVVLHMAWSPISWLSIWFEGGADAYLARIVEQTTPSNSVRLVPYGSGGLTFYVF